MIHTDEDDEFERIAHEIEMKKGQPYVYEKKREWVGLTDEEKQQAYYKIDLWSECVEFIETKLKEKNHDGKYD